MEEDEAVRTRLDPQATYKAFTNFHVKLTDFLQTNEVRNKLSQALRQDGLLPSGCCETAQELVLTVSTQIKHYPEKYQAFVKGLEKCDHAYFKDLIEEMKQANHLCCRPQATARPSLSSSGSAPPTARMDSLSYLDLSLLTIEENSSKASRVVHVHHHHIHESSIQSQPVSTPTQYVDFNRSKYQQDKNAVPEITADQHRMQSRIAELEVTLESLQLKMTQQHEEEKIKLNSRWKSHTEDAEQKMQNRICELEVSLASVQKKMESQFDEERKNLNSKWKHQTEEAEKQASKLEEENASLRARLSEMEDKFKQKNEQLISLMEEREIEKLEVEKLEEDQKALRQTSDDMCHTFEEERQNLIKQVEQSTEECEEYQQLLDEKTKCCLKLEENCKQLESFYQRELKMVKEELHQASINREKEAELVRDLYQQKEQVAQLEEKLREADNERNASLAQLQLKEDTLQKATEAFDSLTESNTQLETEVNFYKWNCEEQSKKCELLNKEMIELRRQSEKADFYKKKWEKSVAENLENVENRRLQKEQAQVNIEERDHEIAYLRRNVTMLQKQLNTKDSQLRESNTSLEKTELEKQQAQFNWEEDISEKKTEIEHLKLKITRLQANLQHFETSTPNPSPDRHHTPTQEPKRSRLPITHVLSTPIMPFIPEQEEGEDTDADEALRLQTQHQAASRRAASLDTGLSLHRAKAEFSQAEFSQAEYLCPLCCRTDFSTSMDLEIHCDTCDGPTTT